MKNSIILILFLTFNLCLSQKVNIANYGAAGNGKTDDTQAFKKAINELKTKYSFQKKPSILYIPSGTYLLSQSLVLDKYISIEGEFINTTVLQTKSTKTPVIILEKNIDESVIYNSYNYIKNISVQGPNYQNSFVENKATTTTNNVGILINGLRTRIEDVQIEGFSNSGIEVNGSYYTFISRVFLKNNAVGLLITNTSTSVYLTQSELRFNSIGVMINNNSYSNFINNNMIESNVATYYKDDTSTNQSNINSRGRGIVLRNALTNFINNNYLENHFVNFTLDSASKNIITNNFYAIGNMTVLPDKNQIFMQMIGNSTENTLSNNAYLTTEPHLEANKIIIDNRDYSSNKIDVGKDNEKIKSLMKKSISNEKNRPIIE